MKYTKTTAIAALILFGVGGASAQSLGDYARAIRKNKTEPTTASRHFDNDNLPVNDALSVVGPVPDKDAASAPAPAATPAANASDRQKATDELQQKMDKQKSKVDALNHELDLDQRELRLRAAALFADPASRLRNPTQWDNDDAKLRTDSEEKQKALDAAKQELDQIQEQAHKAGVDEKAASDKDSAKDKDQDKDKGKDKQ
jgi:hypothetical protein